MAGAFVGGRFAVHFSADLLMGLFGLISLTTGLLMLRRAKSTHRSDVGQHAISVCPLRAPYFRLLFDGFFVGSVTGMVGVGGGFIIVPALTLLVGLPMQGAVGTSLMIIVMNAMAGLAGFSQHAALDVSLTAIVTTGALTGSAMGAVVSGYMKPAWLRRVFGLMVVAVGLYVLKQAVTLELIASIEAWFAHSDSQVWTIGGISLLLLVLAIGSWIHKTDVAVFTAHKTLDGV